MNTTNKNGTYCADIAPGIKKYLKLCGFSNSIVKRNTSPSFDDVIEELDNGGASRPFIFGLQNHKVYGDHAVLAVGYMEFEYKSKQKILGGKYSRYLRIADGWNSSANRFVHFNVGHKSSEKEMVTVKIK